MKGGNGSVWLSFVVVGGGVNEAVGSCFGGRLRWWFSGRFEGQWVGVGEEKNNGIVWLLFFQPSMEMGF
uniref:Uncharacterized protein n=1 Tax=Solanum lycopersicum TaxID=4081 RepID=A0A3Q7J8B0_SOLLC